MVDYNKEFFGENSDSEDEKVNSQNVDYGVGDYNSRFDEVNDYIEPIEEEEKPKLKKRRRRRRSKGEILLFDYVLPIVVGLVMSFLLIHFFGRGVVKGSSMSPTLKDGQNVIIFKSNKHIKRNDIVFLHSDKLEEDIVKRVIAVENDVVEIKGTDVYVNSKKIDDSYTENHTDEQYIKPMKVPEGCIYVLGDNRDDSTDSRVLGPIDVEDVFAKVIYK